MLHVPTSSGVTVGCRCEALAFHGVGLRVLLILGDWRPSLHLDETHGSERRGVNACSTGGVPIIPVALKNTTSGPCTLMCVLGQSALLCNES